MKQLFGFAYLGFQPENTDFLMPDSMDFTNWRIHHFVD